MTNVRAAKNDWKYSSPVTGRVARDVRNRRCYRLLVCIIITNEQKRARSYTVQTGINAVARACRRRRHPATGATRNRSVALGGAARRESDSGRYYYYYYYFM